MSSIAALDELQSKADVSQAKRDLVLRFVRDQESLQTSQVELKLVDDETIDLIDSAFKSTDSQEKQQPDKSQTGPHSPIKSGVSGINLDDGRQVPLAPRPPSGRPQSRRQQQKSSYGVKAKKEHVFARSASDMERRNHALSPTPVLHEANPDHFISCPETSDPLNSSWPQQQFIARKLNSSGSGRKYILCSPESSIKFEAQCDAGGDGTRPMSTQSFGRISAREVVAARVKKHSASDRVSCNLEQITVDPSTRSSSPIKTLSARQGARSRGRAYINLNLEPVHPSELPLLRGASATSSGPYTMVQLPPIAPAATPPSS